MKSRGAPWLVAILQLAALTSLAQHADTIAPAVNFHVADNVSSFTADLRPLHRRAGAPKPFYTYLWEFGDGKFSFEQQPRHIYADTGDYNFRLSRTVLPLPTHAMRTYNAPLLPLEQDAAYLLHPSDWQQFHTRYVTPEPFVRALWNRD